ncbi:hypothetical protein [Saccharopolyspora griseoalba]|uniref:Uncharacterized protein n=1 Tax=Saccharopolyspora griseoalba TaxID=1431848 RepID=A0ABW2LR91_9PSEU
MTNAGDRATAQYALALAVYDQANARYSELCEHEESDGPAPSDMADAVDERLNAAEEALGYASTLIDELAGQAVHVECIYAKIQRLFWCLDYPQFAEFDDDDPAAWAKQVIQLREQFTRLEQLVRQGFLPSSWRSGGALLEEGTNSGPALT